MSSQQSLEQFFASKYFEVPQYQRSYAWEKQNVRELFEDIREAIETKANHYIGTIVLAKTNRENTYNIVDGQQRLTTIVMFIGAIIKNLEFQEDREYYKRYYLKQRDRFKLVPLERDKDFFFNVVDGDNHTKLKPESKSQRYMIEAYNEMLNIVESEIENAEGFLKAISSLSILQFIEEDESDAIRIFQTVNDRGKELSKMDKMKSLVFYFSNKYLDKKYDNEINQKFGEIFELYDDIKLIGEEQRINFINSRQFSEDDILRHHHVCFSEESYDPSAQQVLNNVKSQLMIFRRSSDVEGLDNYIARYLDSLLKYVKSFWSIIKRVPNDESYYKLFSILGLTSVYYPVVIQLENKGFLAEFLPKKKITVLKMIEIIDVRVFKVRGYAGKKHAANFAYHLNNNNETINNIENHLLWFNSFEISDDRFRDFLGNYDYYGSTDLLRILFIDYCENLSDKKFSLDELKNIMDREPTIEHILSQTPNFKPKAFGFKNDDDFEEHNNLIGNLTILEKSINSSIKNNDFTDKVKGYSRSKFKMTSVLATHLSQSNSFTKNDLKDRGQSLVSKLSEIWWAR